MKHVPTVTVLMSVYNGEKYVRQAVDSILQQTFTDFEFLIIDDGSTDETPTILKKYHDARIRIVTQKNKGLVAALNHGLELARGIYIARQDADDASEPNRLAKQTEYLQKHPKTAIVGTSISVMNDTGKIMHIHNVLLNDAELCQELLVRSPFAHGSVVFRKSDAIKVGGYRQAYWPAEDYDLWLRLSSCGNLSNLNEALYQYRENSAGISVQQEAEQIRKAEAVRKLAWTDRKRLAPKERIRLNDYKKLPEGSVLIERIVKNTLTICNHARRNGDVRFALQTAKLITANPVTYRKIGGTLKRKLKKTT